ncbi:MAG: tail fiber domain-containing protein [Prevotellaceae bacterium]|jgi:hypothetical protein|nr:tail fiber domain-containing protein [Prevotellaceae bacterium]
MKNLKIVLIISCCILQQLMPLSAQLKVQDDGKVGVGVGSSSTVLSKLTVGGLGNSSSTAYIVGSTKNGLEVNVGISGYKYGIFSKASSCGSSSDNSIGVYGLGNHNYSECMGIGIGVRGMAGGGTITPRGYGISGIVKGNTGAGVFGKSLAASSTIDSNFETVFTGAYAGYFDGDAVVTGTLTATVVPPSDRRLKKDVVNLDELQTVNKLMQLRPVEYNMQQVLFEVDSTDKNGNKVTYQVQRYDENTQFFQKKHYGLVAQEVQNIFPDLVYEGSDGYLGVDYTSLVPMLLKIVQQQQTEIESLKNSERANAPKRNSNSEISRNAELFQNTPNPFNENSEIAFYLPQDVKNAMLCVYDMNGKQLSQNIIAERGDAKFVINGKSYAAGMYLYSLIADNQIIDTKRMILTK